MPKPRTCLLFDWDGTLAESHNAHYAAFRHTFQIHLGRRVDDSELAPIIGHTLRDIMARFGATTEEQWLDFAADFYQHYYGHHKELVVLYPGVIDMVARLHQAGLPMALVTSKPGAALEREAVHTRVAQAFATFVAYEDTEQHKPSPAPLLEALRRLGLGPDEGVVIGDNASDVAAGHAAGMPTILALWGSVAREEALAAKPDHVVEAPADLPSVLAAYIPQLR